MAHIEYKFENVKSEQELREICKKQYKNDVYENENSWEIFKKNFGFDEIINDYNWANIYGQDKLINYDSSKAIYSNCISIFNNESKDFLKSLMELEICILDKNYSDSSLAKALFSCESLRPIFIQNILDYIIKFYDKIEEDLYITRYNNRVVVEKKYDKDYYTMLSSDYNFRNITSDIYLSDFGVFDLPEKPIEPDKQQIKISNQQKYVEEKKNLQLLRKKLVLLNIRLDDESEKEQERLERAIKEEREKAREKACERWLLDEDDSIICGPPYDDNKTSKSQRIRVMISNIENQIKEIENLNNEKVHEEEYKKEFSKYKEKLERYKRHLYNYQKSLIIQPDCIKYRNLFLEHFGLSTKVDSEILKKADYGNILQKTNHDNILQMEPMKPQLGEFIKKILYK